MRRVHATLGIADVEANTWLSSCPTGKSSSILKVNVGLFKLFYVSLYAYKSLF